MPSSVAQLSMSQAVIRALALLSLTILAACSHSRAAPPEHPQASASEGSPEDPYGDEAQGRFAGEHCPPGETCSFACDQGGCSFSCAEGSTCNVECDGGRCRTSCGFNATCNVECDGGQCGTGCGTGATCNMECDGGSCAHACADDATCNAECEGGNCAS